MVSIHAAMDLKHPQALSLKSIRLSISAFLPLNLQVGSSEVQEKEGGKQRISNPQIPESRFLCQSHSMQFSYLLESRAMEFCNNASQAEARRERDLGFVSHSPKILHPIVTIKTTREGLFLCYTGMQFIKPLFTVELPRCHIHLTSTPTRVRMYPCTHKGDICVYKHIYICIVLYVYNVTFLIILQL